MERGLTLPDPVELGDGVGTKMKLPGKRLSVKHLPHAAKIEAVIRPYKYRRSQKQRKNGLKNLIYCFF